MSPLAFDIEGHKIQPGLLTPPIVCVSFAYEKESFVAPKAEGLDLIAAALMERTTFVGANIAYDWGCVLAERPDLLRLVWEAYEEGRVHDVLIAASLDAIHAGRMSDGELFRSDGTKIQKGRYSLEETVREYLGRSDAKRNDKWRKSYALLEGKPIMDWPEEARQYPVDDAQNTLLVYRAQLARARNLHNQPAQAHAALCTHLGAIWGLRTDQQEVAKVKAEVDGHLASAEAFARASGLMRLGGTKKAPKWSKHMAVIKEAVFKAYDGLPPVTETGGVSTSRETLEDSLDPVLVKFAEGSKWEKLRTYANTLSDLGSKPMNVSCNILVSTGRASYDGLVQLMPRKGGIRECFVAREGTVWSSVDFAAIEMSTLAQVQLWTVGHSKLADMLNAGLDPHSGFAAEMLGVPYADFMKRKKEVFEAGMRQAAKAANFGFPGMMGPVKFVIAKKKEGLHPCQFTQALVPCGENKVRQWKGKELDSPMCAACIEAATKLRAAYLLQWPEMKLYWNWVTTNMKDDRLEQFVSQRMRGGLSAPAAANTLFQGLAADGAKAAVVAMTKEMYLDSSSPLFGSRLMLFAHDEVILEIPEERLHEAAYRQAEVMVDVMHTRYCPDVRVSAEPALMRRWSKSADTVRDADGKLTVWTKPL